MRDCSPCFKHTFRTGTLKRVAINFNSASLARPSSGGAAKRIFNASPCKPARLVIFAAGCTCKFSVIQSPLTINQVDFLGGYAKSCISNNATHQLIQEINRHHLQQLTKDNQREDRQINTAYGLDITAQEADIGPGDDIKHRCKRRMGSYPR
jgi:hypothetical protein